MSSVTDLFALGQLPEHDIRLSAISRVRKIDTRRYSTGLDNVDQSANLFQPGGFIVIGAREGQGKTAIAERIAMANAREHRVLFVSLDMPRLVVQDRILAKSMQLSVKSVSALECAGSAHFGRALKSLDDLDCMVWRPGKGKKSAEQIIKKAEQISAAILIIDYTRRMDGWDYGKPAADIVDTIADWTQEADLQCATILLTQLKDEAVNKTPHNGYIQDTTQISQRADRIQMIYRPYQGNPAKDNIAEIITTKNRWGPSCKNHAGWIGETMDFFPMDAEEEANAKCCRSM